MKIVEFIFWVIAISFGICYAVYQLLETDAASEIKSTPKVPMLSCDKHGIYPESAALWIEVPEEGKPDLKQQICPFCFNERLEAAEDRLKVV